MSVKNRGLGKNVNALGLDALLSEITKPAATQNIPSENSNKDLLYLPIDMIQPGKYQPRKDFEPQSLEDLANSIRAQGILQPILLRKIAEHRYEIIAGERRWRAAQIAGLEQVPVIVRIIADEAAMAMALIENIQREDLNAMEEAIGLHRLIDEFGMTHQQIAESIGKSRTTVTNLLRLLSLENEAKTLLERGDLEMGHARALLALQGAAQKQAARTIVAKGLSVREAENLVRNYLNKTSSTHQKTKVIDPNIQALQKELSDKLGAAVTISHSGKGRGKLIIQYHSLDELQGILERIG